MNVEALLTTPWRTGPAWLLVLLGAWLVARAIGRWRGLPSELRDPARALAIARSGRRIILGLCVIGFGVGWMLSTEWVVLLALVILGEEMLETSTMVLALRRGVEGPAGDSKRSDSESGHGRWIEGAVSPPTDACKPSTW